jgi:hypothetical protein
MALILNNAVYEKRFFSSDCIVFIILVFLIMIHSLLSPMSFPHPPNPISLQAAIKYGVSSPNKCFSFSQNYTYGMLENINRTNHCKTTSIKRSSFISTLNVF